MLYFRHKEDHMKENTAITLGNFDGLHKGHMKLLDTVNKLAKEKGLLSVAFSFHPHPLTVLTNKPVQTIFSQEEKYFLMSQIGMTAFVDFPFDLQVAKWEPDFFVHEILYKKYKCKVLVVGEDYKFGSEKKGNLNVLMALGDKYGIQVVSVPSVFFRGEKISSTTIRHEVRQDNFNVVAEMMGRPYLIMGTIVTGRKIGRTIGFPTANIQPHPNKLLPGNGVYVTKISYEGKIYPSVTNIGRNPTVGGETTMVETHIFDFNESAYHKNAIVYFYHKLRPEVHFNSLDELKKQIDLDANQAKTFWYTNKDLLPL